MAFELRERANRRVASVTVGASLVLAMVAGPAQAGVHVIELFTSQSCAKCPPADKLIADFARQPDTIALSFPVNYWDYSGWKDTLASPAFTARQTSYAAARGDRRIFTPQAIVDGIGVEPGADKAAILQASADVQQREDATRIPIGLSEADGHLHVDVGIGSKRAGDARVGIYILRVAKQKVVQIGRGENSGRTVTYTNVVRAMRRVGDWTGQAEHFDVIELAEPGEGYVVLLQAGPPDRLGAILASAKTENL